ncbi:MAG TPA: hypothetical protein VGH14_09275 [Solirubrobacterales bacterium]
MSEHRPLPGGTPARREGGVRGVLARMREAGEGVAVSAAGSALSAALRQAFGLS